MNRTLALAASAALALGGLSSNAQSYTTDASMLSPDIVDGQTPIILPRGLSLHHDLWNSKTLKPTVTIEAQGRFGYDAHFEFVNDTSITRPLGRLNIGVLALGEQVAQYDHAQVSQLRELNYGNFTGTGWTYPGTAYSPATVVMNETHVVGVSLHYPVMEYKHGALVRLSKAGGIFKGPAETRGWFVSFDLNNTSSSSYYTTLQNPAFLDPGQSRSYTISVRAMKKPEMGSSYAKQEWMQVLEPYRDFFQSTYGAVQYERRTSPVHGRELANISAQSSQNRRGMLGQSKRPDRVGFAPIAAEIAQQRIGYDNVMLWAPSGLFDLNTDLNYPSLFTAGWLDDPKLQSATDSIGLPVIARAGKELGLWWGRSAEYVDQWNATESVPLNPDNPVHMAQVYLQMDLATDVGATMIGLDRFVHRLMPVWKQTAYLADLRQRYPGVSFITEQMSSDLMHVVTPTLNRGFKSGDDPQVEQDYHRLANPHYLADYLVPGHETWAYWRYAEILGDDRIYLQSERVQRDAEFIASNGYVPCIVSPVALLDADAANAGETWLTTVPTESTDRPGDDSGGSGDDSTIDKPGDGPDDEVDPAAEKVHLVTLPNGRRLRIVTGRGGK